MPDNYKAKRAAEEYRGARAAVLAQLDPLVAARRRGVFLPSGDFRRMAAMRRALSKAHESRTHETRMRTLRAVLAPGWTFTPEHTEPSPLAAFAAALNPPDGALGIEASFSLSATPTITHTTQRSLFD